MWIHATISPILYMFKSRIAASFSPSIFNLLRSCQTLPISIVLYALVCIVWWCAHLSTAWPYLYAAFHRYGCTVVYLRVWFSFAPWVMFLWLYSLFIDIPLKKVWVIYFFFFFFLNDRALLSSPWLAWNSQSMPAMLACACSAFSVASIIYVGFFN